MNKSICFRSVDFSDINQITYWFNLPHVQKFYSLRSWTEKEVFKKLYPYIQKEKPVCPFIILLQQNPIGYLQYYPVSDYPWPEQNLPETMILQAFGMDLFIGDPNLLGKGLGEKIIETFIKHHIKQSYRYCIVDPDINNLAGIRCYEKLGFKKHAIIATEDALFKPIQLKLMILDCNKLKKREQHAKS